MVRGEGWLTHPGRRQRAIAIDLPLQLIVHALHFDGLRLRRSDDQALESVGIFWLVQTNGFATMHNSVRSVALELHENIGAIEEWLATLPERERRWLVHPIRVTRRWRQSPRTTRRSADVATYFFRTFVNAARNLAAGWLAAVHVRVISSPDRPNTRPPQRYRVTGPAA